jgi:hypothetical protein
VFLPTRAVLPPVGAARSARPGLELIVARTYGCDIVRIAGVPTAFGLCRRWEEE